MTPEQKRYLIGHHLDTRNAILEAAIARGQFHPGVDDVHMAAHEAAVRLLRRTKATKPKKRKR
jgi:hypothetical protein